MPAVDNFSRQQTIDTSPFNNAAAIVLHDTNELANVTRGIYVGVGGNIKVSMWDSGVVTFTGVPTGTVLDIRAKIVWSTGTTATTMLALW